MKFLVQLHIFFSSLFLSTVLFSAEFESIVKDKVFNTSSRVVIDEKAIKESLAQNVTELLSSQANISIANTATKPNMIFLRGADSGHILILVDGVPFYDASSSDRTFNLNSLDLKNIRKIEVLKGSQTVLFGGQALGGVIMIDTLPRSIENKTQLKVETSSEQKLNSSVYQNIKISDSQGLKLQAHSIWENNESPVLHSNEKYPKKVASAEANYYWKGDTQGHLKAQYVKDYNRQPISESRTNYTIVDTPDYEIRTQNTAISTALKFSQIIFEPELNIGYQKSYREFYQGLSDFNSVLTDQDYWSELRTARLTLKPFQSESLNILLGLTYTYEQLLYKYNDSTIADDFNEQRGLFSKVDYKMNENLKLTGGFRLENWNRHNSFISSYQTGLTWNENTRFEHSTGYKIPSLFQLYSSYGNSDLKQESSQQNQLSYDYKINENNQISSTLFESTYSNLIITQGSPLRYNNVKKSKTSGIEIALNSQLSESTHMIFNLGYQEPRDLDQNTWLAKRPLKTAGLKVTIKHNDIVTTFYEVQAASEKVDNNTNTTTVSLPGYAVAHTGVSYKWSEEIGAFVRITNLTNQRHQESYSYYSTSRQAQLGLEAWF